MIDIPIYKKKKLLIPTNALDLIFSKVDAILLPTNSC